jgi:hypothetical protein
MERPFLAFEAAKAGPLAGNYYVQPSLRLSDFFQAGLYLLASLLPPFFFIT